ncbi:polyamine-transporting ATPase 13A3-like isoform X2 [Daphnia carinata]|uniref:polyamine-transporting ATPase 13A3-like isoform X2 n=1 Tax=Daphnia carinata TaxID=120202 RepID=UPI00257D0110|nr:polyamine-transporting ATPase 13A3-like isoform X2 [Daphnia carinata]
MYKTSDCLNEIVAMSNNKLKDTEDNRLAEQHQLLRLTKQMNQLPNGEDGRTTSPDIPYSRNASVSYINAGDEDQMELYGYRRSNFRTALTWLFILKTLGILRMVFHWFPEWFLNCTYTRCSLEVAEKVLIVEIYQKKHRRVHIRSITCMSALEIINAANNQTARGKKKSAEHCNSHVLQDLNRIDDAPSLSLPNADGTFRNSTSVRMFTCKKLRYIWNIETKEFLKVKSLGPGMPTSSLHHAEAQQGLAGLSLLEQQRRRAIFGSNFINVPVKSVLELLLLEVLNPFYIFQVVSVLIWIMIEYYYFAAAIMVMSAAGITISIIQTRKNQKKLRNTVHGSDIIDVCRGGGVYETIRTEELVPGDLIILPANGCTMHCDAVLLFGTCIVNESMLTGESVPVTKTPLPFQSDVLYHPKEHSRHTLFSGTKVVQTRFYNDEKVMAVVTSTGFMTAKGSLVSAIMYPPPVDFRFERDSYRFIGFLASLASIGFTYSIIKKIISGEAGLKVVFHSFDIITICVPPALPAAMTAGIILAQKRLERRNIFCISPRSINVSGSLNCICFDKTGTLTEDGLDLWGIVPVVEGRRYIPPLRTPLKLSQALSTLRPYDRSPSSASCNKLDPPLLLMGMATCHSLTIIDGNLSGDPLDLKMFESTGWVLVEPSNEDTSKYDNICPTVVTWTPEGGNKTDPETSDSVESGADGAKVEVGIVRQFPFSSSLQRMAIICKRIGQEQLHFFCKGSPEMVQSLCKPDTVPGNHNQILEEYTRQGFRVIALAHRLVEIRSIHKLQKVQREELEHELTFLGLVVLENRLKPDTKAIVNQLSDAAVRTIMVTGDNLLTAISVARDCGMVGSHDQVVILNYEETIGASSTEGKPRLTYTLAEKSSIQTPCNTTSPSTMNSSGDTTLDITDTDFNCHLAITGKCWSVIQEHYQELVPRCVVKGTIFARMSPDQKQQLVQALQQLNYVVGMCGDGANDCGALKAAHAGISLSDSEASVASPFTSREASISCVPELIRQGRCALVTSFGIFKYMAAYSLTQFISVMILYEIGTNLTDFQFLYIDLFLICSLSAVFGRTQPHPGPLFNRPPLTSLLSLPPVGSLLIQVCLVGFFQAISMFILTQQDWFVPYMTLHNNVTGLATGDYASHENYAIFSMSMCQYIVLALAYAKGRPFREVFLKNYWFVGALGASTAFSLYVLIDPGYAIKKWLELEMPPMEFRLVILSLSAAQVIVCLLTEEIVIDRGLVKVMESSFWLKLRPRKEKYLAVEKEIKLSDWPPVENLVELSPLGTSAVAQK